MFPFFLVFHINGIIQCVIFCVCLAFTEHNVPGLHLCCNMYKDFALSLLLSNVFLYGYATFCSFLHLDRHLDCFQLLALMNEVAMNICRQILVQTYVFISLGKILRIGIAEPYVYMLNLCVSF